MRIKRDANRSVRSARALDPFSVAGNVWPDRRRKTDVTYATFFARHSEVHTYVRASICAGSRSCIRCIASNLRKFAIARARVRSSARFIRSRDQIIVPRCIAISRPRPRVPVVTRKVDFTIVSSEDIRGTSVRPSLHRNPRRRPNFGYVLLVQRRENVIYRRLLDASIATWRLGVAIGDAILPRSFIRMKRNQLHVTN